MVLIRCSIRMQYVNDIIEIQRNFSLYLLYTSYAQTIITTRDPNGYIIKLKIKIIHTLLVRSFLRIIVIYLELEIKKIINDTHMVKYNLMYMMDIDYNILLMLLLWLIMTMTHNVTKLVFLYFCHSVMIIFGNSSKHCNISDLLNTNTRMIFSIHTIITVNINRINDGELNSIGGK